MAETASEQQQKLSLADQLKEKFTSKPTANQLMPKFKRPEFVDGVRVRMPEDYDFSTKGVDWKEYEKDFRLRTDAVWEKYQLKDWFRLYYKCFYYNKGTRKYEFIEPEDMYTVILEPWTFEEEDVDQWKGFSPTGRTTSFQIGLGPKQRVATTFNTFYSMPDYYMLCAMRFEKWWRCDMVYYKDRGIKFDHSPLIGKSAKYPCFREYYEANYACADDIFKYLMELAYNKRANDFFEGDYSNRELLSFPTVYDTPKAPERITYTY